MVFARAFALTWVAYCGFYLCRKNLSVLMPYLKSEQGYTSASLADVLFLYSAAYAAGQVLMGHLTDRFGSRVVVTSGALVSAACSTLTGSAVPLVLSQGLNGMAQSCGWPGVLKLARDWFPAANLGVVMAWWGTHLVVGGFLATNLAAAVAADGWRRGAWIPAVLLSIVAALFGALARDRAPAATPVHSTRLPRAPLTLTRPLVAIATMYFCVKMARYSFLFWLPLYMTERLHYSPVEAGYASSAFELVGFGGVLLAGYTSERFLAGARFPAGALMMAALAVLCVAYPYASRLGLAANLAAISLVGAFTFGPDVLMAGAGTQEAAPPGMVGRAAGFVNGIGSVGQLLSPFLVAGVSSAFGWEAMFACLGTAAFAGSVALASQWRKA